MINFFETHAHPDHPLVEDIEGYFQSARNAGIDRLVDVAITYESNFRSLNQFPQERFPEVYFAKGLHPKYAMNTSFLEKTQLEQFCQLLLDRRVVAVKTGLDFCQKKVEEQQFKRQYEFLRLFMNLAYEYNKPLVLHIRKAADEAVEFFGKNPLRVSAEFHCYTYGKDIMRKFIDVGVHYFGIGGMIARSENVELQEAVKAMPLEMILLESDAPFVKVEGDKDKINSSAKAIPVVAAKIAELKGITVEEVADVTYENANRFFGLDRV